MTSSTASSSAITTYGYDHTAQRVWMNFSSATTSYPSRYYSTQGATSTITKYIFAPSGGLLATINGSGTSFASTTKNFIHADWLGGTNVITNASGTVARVQDYYPYGADRVNSGPASVDRGYIGERKDQQTGLLYLNARYYEPGRGQFLSEDPVFWEVGMTGDGKAVLQNPQLQNSYSYAGNNPITQKDPTGRYAETVYNRVSQFGVPLPGAHAFTLITFGVGGGQINFPGGGMCMPQITIGGYPSNGNLVLDINRPSDFNMSSSQYLARERITPPAGMSADDYDRVLTQYALGAKSNNGGVLAPNYAFPGQPFGNNSGNAQTTLIKSTGGSFSPNYFPAPLTWAAGVGTPISQPQSASQALSGLVSAFAPTNSVQAKALQNVISAFTPKK